jgi:hypothetical protein
MKNKKPGLMPGFLLLSSLNPVSFKNLIVSLMD